MLLVCWLLIVVGCAVRVSRVRYAVSAVLAMTIRSVFICTHTISSLLLHVSFFLFASSQNTQSHITQHVKHKQHVKAVKRRNDHPVFGDPDYEAYAKTVISRVEAEYPGQFEPRDIMSSSACLACRVCADLPGKGAVPPLSLFPKGGHLIHNLQTHLDSSVSHLFLRVVS